MDYTVDAVDKAIGLLLLVAEFPDLGVTELAKRSGNTKARAFRLLGTLESNGLVKRDPNAAYRLGHQVLYLGAAAQGQLDIARLAEPLFREMSATCNEAMQIRIRDGVDTVCIARRESPHEVRIHAEIGNRRPMYLGASGKLLLAYASDGIREQVLSGDMPKFTPYTISSRKALEKELKKILAAGHSISISERNSDAFAVAVPVRDSSGEVVAALGISGPTIRLVEGSLEVFIACAKKGAERFSRELGYNASQANE